jgi:hypothetical protein
VLLKKWAAGSLQGPFSCEGQNLQRGTANADDGEVAGGVSYQVYGEVISARQDAIFGFEEKFSRSLPSRRRAKKEGHRIAPGPYKCEGQKTSRGEQLLRWNWEEKPPCASAVCDMVVFCAVNNALLCRSAMRDAQHCCREEAASAYLAAVYG